MTYRSEDSRPPVDNDVGSLGGIYLSVDLKAWDLLKDMKRHASEIRGLFNADVK